MYFLVLGVLFLLLKLAGIGPVEAWPWWGVLAPFGLAAAWWMFADASGYYKRREMRKMNAKVASRRERNLTALKGDHKPTRTK